MSVMNSRRLMSVPWLGSHIVSGQLCQWIGADADMPCKTPPAISSNCFSPDVRYRQVNIRDAQSHIIQPRPAVR